MRRFCVVCAALLVAAATLIAGDDPAPAATGPVLVVGDSLVVGTTPYLRREIGGRVRSDGRIGRPSSEAVGVLRSLISASDRVVVFDAGTNDDPANPGRLASDLAAAHSIAGRRCLVVATVNRPPYRGVSVAGLNRAVRSFASSSSTVRLVDWRSAAVSHPSLINADGVHPTASGYAYRARLFAGAIESCGGAQPAIPTEPSAPPSATPPPASVGPPPGRSTHPRAHRPRAKPKRPRRLPQSLGGEGGIFSDEPLSFNGAGARLSGELLSPADSGRHPAVVMIPGGGHMTRAAYRDGAEYFAQHGVSALIYDERGSGESTGSSDYRYADLVGDARAGVDLLARRADVRPDGIGVWTASEGGYVAPAVAAADPRVKAVLAVAPAAITPASRRDWAVRDALRADGAGNGTHPVTTYYRLAAGAGGAPVATRSTADLDYDPAAAWRRVAQPVLAIWASRDPREPPHASAAALATALGAGPNRDRTFRTFAGAATDVAAAPDVMALSATWLRSRLGGHAPEPAVSTPLPPHAADVAPVNDVSPSLLDRWPLQLVWLLLPALALAALLGRRAVKARGAAADALEAPVRRWALPGGVVVLDVAALGALGVAVASIVQTDGRDVSAVAGVPAVIAVAWVLALAALIATLVLARRAVREGRAAASTAVCTASALWLLLLAYWLI